MFPRSVDCVQYFELKLNAGHSLSCLEFNDVLFARLHGDEVRVGMECVTGAVFQGEFYVRFVFDGDGQHIRSSQEFGILEDKGFFY